MSIGFSFTGVAGNLEAFLVRCRKLARDRDYGIQIGKNGLRFLLCPLGGDLYVRWKDSGDRWLGHLAQGECQSTPAGPGFHKAACELLDALELRRLAVKDETDYFSHRDFDRMREEHFYSWLNNLIHTCLDRMDPKSYELVCLCWDLNQYRPEGVPGTVVTPMGRFDLKKLAAQADEGGIRDIAGRFFLWNDPERDACFFRNLAVNALWENCAFVPSFRSEEDARTNGGILDSLEQAARLDPALPLPRAAYREVCALAERVPAIPDGPELDFDYAPGFRKGLVTYAFGALSITLPGSYCWDWEEYENGGGNNRCWDSSAQYPVIWRVSAFRRRAGQAEFTSDFQDPSKVTLREFPNGSARLRWLELDDGDGPYCQAQCQVSGGSTLYVVTVTCLRQEDREEVAGLLERLSLSQEGEPEGEN